MTKELPAEEDVLKLLEKVGCSKEVIDHCVAVSKLAVKIAELCRKKGIGVNVDLVKIGGLLHDIGRSRTHSVGHNVIGAELARNSKLPQELIYIIQRHVGGGISEEEAEHFGWPKAVYTPQSIEEKIISYADKLMNGSKKVSIEEEIEALSRKLGPTHPAIRRVKTLDEEFRKLLGESLEELLVSDD